MSAYNPKRLYIGGEVTAAWELIEKPIRAALVEGTLTDAARATPVYPDSNPAEYRLLGAVALVAAPTFAALASADRARSKRGTRAKENDREHDQRRVCIPRASHDIRALPDSFPGARPFRARRSVDSVLQPGFCLSSGFRSMRALRDRQQLVLVGDRRVVRLRELAAARLRELHALLDARLRPRPVALAVEVAVRTFERQLPAPLVEHRVAEQIVAQARRHRRNAGARADRVHRGVRLGRRAAARLRSPPRRSSAAPRRSGARCSSAPRRSFPS